MNFSDEAKREIEKNLGEITRNMKVDDRERMEIVNELRSTYYEAAEEKARARGSDTVTLADACAAKSNISSPRETAEGFMKSYAAGLKRAGFWSRFAAFVIDCVILMGLVLIIMSPILAFMLLTGMPTDEVANEAWFYDLSPALKVLFISTALTVMPAFLIVILGYYFVIEGHFGRTPGKYIMGLRVLKTDGTKIGYKEAILRNLSKYNNYLIVVDVLIMLLFFRKEKQRGFDRIADTIVVHARK